MPRSNPGGGGKGGGRKPVALQRTFNAPKKTTRTVKPQPKPAPVALKRKFNAPRSTRPVAAKPKLKVNLRKQRGGVKAGRLGGGLSQSVELGARHKENYKMLGDLLAGRGPKPVKVPKYVAAPKPTVMPRDTLVKPANVKSINRAQSRPVVVQRRQDKRTATKQVKRLVKGLTTPTPKNIRRANEAGQALRDMGVLRGKSHSKAVLKAQARQIDAGVAEKTKRRYALEGALKESFKGYLKGNSSDPLRRQSKGSGTAAVLAASASPADRQLLANAGKDLIDLPAQTLASAYYTGKPAAEALREVARGDLKKAGKKAGESAKMIYEPYKNLVAQPGKSARESFGDSLKEHPVITGLMLYGLAKAPGLAAGKALRVAPGRKVRNIGSIKTDYKGRERPSAVVRTSDGGKTQMAQKRYYSKDAFVKAAQVYSESRKRKRGEPVTVDFKGGKFNSGQRFRANATRSESVGIGRTGRTKVIKETKKAVGKKPDAGLILYVQKAVAKQGDNGDLLGELKKVRSQWAAIKHEGKQAARQKENLKTLDKVIKKFDQAKTETAAANYMPINLRLQKELADVGMIAGEQSVRARLMPYAQNYMGAAHDGHSLVRPGAEPRRSLRSIERDIAKTEQEIKTLQKRGGPTKEANAELRMLEREREHYHRQTLPTEEIQAHLAKNNPDLPEAAFVTHDPNIGGKNSMYASSARAPNFRTKRRTGAAMQEGLVDLRPEVLVEANVRAQQLASSAREWAKVVGEASLRDRGDKVSRYKNWQDAKARSEELLKQGDGEWVPVRAEAFGSAKSLVEAQRELVDESFTQDKTQHQFNKDLAKRHADAFDGTESTPAQTKGPWVLMPKAYAEALQAHADFGKGVGTGPASRAVGNVFRPLVLATSTKWLTGNIVEGAGRSAFAHAGPRSYFTSRQVLKRLKELDPDIADVYMEQVLGGGAFGMAERSYVYVSREDFAQGTWLRQLADRLHELRNTPGPGTLSKAWSTYTHFVMQVVNATIERQFQHAMAGKRIRETLMDDNLVKLSDKAFDNAARGLMDRNEMVSLGRSIDRMYGRYSKMSPAERAWIAEYTPFIMWAINASFFVLRTLPVDHPVATSLLASMNVSSEEWRKSQGLSYFVDNALPGWLQGSIPGKDGSHLQATRYTPFGAFTGETSLYGTLTGALLPQFMTFYEAGKGREWTGKELAGANKDKLPAAGKEVLLTLLGQTVPFFNMGRTIAKSKEETTAGKIRSAVDPFRFTPNNSKKGSKGTLVLDGGPKTSSGGSSNDGVLKLK